MGGPIPIKTEQVYSGLYSVSAAADDDDDDRCWVEYWNYLKYWRHIFCNPSVNFMIFLALFHVTFNPYPC